MEKSRRQIEGMSAFAFIAHAIDSGEALRMFPQTDTVSKETNRETHLILGRVAATRCVGKKVVKSER